MLCKPSLDAQEHIVSIRSFYYFVFSQFVQPDGPGPFVPWTVHDTLTSFARPVELLATCACVGSREFVSLRRATAECTVRTVGKDKAKDTASESNAGQHMCAHAHRQRYGPLALSLFGSRLFLYLV